MYIIKKWFIGQQHEAMNRFNSLETQYNMLKVSMVHTVYYIIQFVLHLRMSGRTVNAVGTQATGMCFHSFFRVLPNFHECFYNSIETQRTCFLLENTVAKKENNLVTLIIKLKIIFARTIIASIAPASSVLLLSYGNTI